MTKARFQQEPSKILLSLHRLGGEVFTQSIMDAYFKYTKWSTKNNETREVGHTDGSHPPKEKERRQGLISHYYSRLNYTPSVGTWNFEQFALYSILFYYQTN